MKLIILICSLFLLSCDSTSGLIMGDRLQYTIEIENCKNKTKDTILGIGYIENRPYINSDNVLIVSGYPVANNICKISVLNIRKLEIK